MKYIRVSEHINEDLNRGWSSWNFGEEGFSGSQDDLLTEIRSIAECGGEFWLSGFNIWIDENTKFDDGFGVVFVDDYEIRELYRNYWVAVDRVNAVNGLSAHELPESLQTIEDIISEIKNNPAKYDGTGDGESFSTESAKVLHSFEFNGKNYHIIEA
ncbi:MAG: hypothetical protein VB075_18420 [Petrimonas sp.]|uniref:hypothetical protein n=1 Tax=Petrimonas sp. TaxID=2023866 RepID=UPI002B3A389E|nr:hypothetical protein [Petrimonas sp.]